MVHKSFGIWRDFEAARMRNVFLNAFFLDLRERKTELFLSSGNAAAGRPLIGTPPANIAVAGIRLRHGNSRLSGTPREAQCALAEQIMEMDHASELAVFTDHWQHGDFILFHDIENLCGRISNNGPLG